MALTAKQENKFLESSLFVGCEKDSLRGLAQIVMPHSLFKGEVLRVTREQEAGRLFAVRENLKSAICTVSCITIYAPASALAWKICFRKLHLPWSAVFAQRQTAC